MTDQELAQIAKGLNPFGAGRCLSTNQITVNAQVSKGSQSL